MPGRRAPLVLFGVLLLQASVVGQIEIAGARPDVVLLVPVVAALVAGPDRGAVAGFAAGLAADAVLWRTTPFGLGALSYCLTGYVVGTFQARVLRATWWLPVAAAALGSAVGLIAFAVAGTVVGLVGVVSASLLVMIVVVAVVNAALVRPAAWLGRWVEEPADRTRVGIR
ncbi:MAG: rod shape-determining protein MreD [Acidimicrobiia bacterium]|jgi:rod shape-determining protein MreD|nr:rod shape-determining protein MreD [Acidimicrobiia bacterium]